ncbi:MAG TPA: O-antigen ligase family protein [Thermoanaerobaculia bacterium]|nr:O-antigen ligase family protein [Thermoanaerobaculia bacterium]
MIRHSGVALTALLAVLLLWAPLPFGGVTSWGEASLQVLAFCALALAMAAIDRPSDLRPVALPAAALAAVALLGCLQALPWPEALVRLISPGQARLHDQAVALLGAAAGPARLTVAAAASRAAVLSWAAAAACLLAGAAAGRRRYRRRWLGGAVLAAALFQVFFGARNANAGERTLWGVEVPIAASRLRGTFFNPNHLAAYLEIALALVFAWGWWAARRARTELALDRRVLSLAPPALIWLTLFAGLTFTASRGGLAAALAGIVAQGVLLATVQRRWAPAMLGAAAAAAGIAAAIATGLQAGPARMLATLPFDVSVGARRQGWAATVALWKGFPLTGTGLGTFRDAFTLEQPASLDGTWWHAHSGPLELLATTGPAGPLLVGAGLVALVLRLLAVVRRGRRSEDRAAGLAALGALTAVGMHECIDFGLTMPANALTLAVLAGAAASARLASVPAVAGAPLGGGSGAAGTAAAEGAPGGVRPRRSSGRAGKPDGARHHGAAGDRLELEQVKARRHRDA